MVLQQRKLTRYMTIGKDLLHEFKENVVRSSSLDPTKAISHAQLNLWTLAYLIDQHMVFLQT